MFAVGNDRNKSFINHEYSTIPGFAMTHQNKWATPDMLFVKNVC